MLTPNNKIIIVDNETKELYDLGKVFLDNGLICRTFEYSELHDEPLEGVRIAFFDIKLNPSGGASEEQIFSTLVQALKLYIDLKNKPFILIFWTKHNELVANFKDYISSRNDDTIPSPFMVDCIDKLEIRGEPKALMDKLKKILNEPTIKAIFDFESKALNAASKTVNSIFELVQSNDVWGESNSFISNFNKVFSKIAISILGKDHAIENPDKAIYSALMPILNYNLENSGSTNYWQDLLTEIRNKNIKFPDDTIAYKLNSVFHIDNNKEFDHSTRGGVIKLNLPQDKFNDLFKKNFKSVFGDIIPFDEEYCSKSDRDEFRRKSEFLLIEISAACDYSQKNPRLNKYVLTLKTPQIDLKKIRQQSQSIFKDIPLFEFDGEIFKLWVNFNYVFGLLPTDCLLGKQRFILKSQIINQIGSRYANHVSRIGIASF
jgi:hypothetical protein